MHYEVSVIVKVPREKAYKAFTDFEAGPKWSKERTALKVSKKEGNNVYLSSASGASNPGRKMRLFPPERVESSSESRFSKTKSVVKFERAPEGTKVTASLDMEVKGHWSWVMKTRGKEGVESSAMEMLKAFAKYVEGIP